MYWFLWAVAPAITMIAAAYWQRKTVFWLGAVVSAGLTHWLLLVAERHDTFAALESARISQVYSDVIKRDVPWSEFGPTVAIVLTLAWGALAWYAWPRCKSHWRIFHGR